VFGSSTTLNKILSNYKMLARMDKFDMHAVRNMVAQHKLQLGTTTSLYLIRALLSNSATARLATQERIGTHIMTHVIRIDTIYSMVHDPVVVGSDAPIQMNDYLNKLMECIYRHPKPQPPSVYFELQEYNGKTTSFVDDDVEKGNHIISILFNDSNRN
jgi:hypothetical protein